jgi:RimJ/RimL family protein N-acetyltransferase
VTATLAAPPPLRDGEVELLPVDSRVAALLVAASNDAEITRWTQVPEGMSLLDAGLIAAAWSDSRRTVRMQVCVPGQAPAGMVTVWINGEAHAEVGYWLLASVRGRGVATRAVRLMCDWVLAAPGIERLQLTTLPGNSASEHVASACGFHRAGKVTRQIKNQRRTLSLWEREPTAAGQREVIGT